MWLERNTIFICWWFNNIPMYRWGEESWDALSPPNNRVSNVLVHPLEFLLPINWHVPQLAHTNWIEFHLWLIDWLIDWLSSPLINWIAFELQLQVCSDQEIFMVQHTWTLIPWRLIVCVVLLRKWNMFFHSFVCSRLERLCQLNQIKCSYCPIVENYIYSKSSQ